MGRTGRDSYTGLTDRQKRFVEMYTQHWDAKRAANEAGYKNPAELGRRMIDGKSHPKVCKAIERIQRENLRNAILTREQILEELSSLAMRDIIDLCDEDGVFFVDDLRDLPPYIRRCIDGLECEQKFDEEGNLIGQRFKLKLVAKLGAIEMLAKHYGMFAPKQHEHSHVLDWDTLYRSIEGPDNLDVIEGEIAKAEEE